MVGGILGGMFAKFSGIPEGIDEGISIIITGWISIRVGWVFWRNS